MTPYPVPVPPVATHEPAAVEAPPSITGILAESRSGQRAATDRLFVLLYDELKRLARRKLAGSDAPMRATSLVHEAWIKLAAGAPLSISDREHFHATAARVMRQVIIDHIRSRDAQRRGGGQRVDALDDQALTLVATEEDERVLLLDAALVRLGALDPPLAALVELRFYGGLELAEISALNGRSERSLKRDWRRARAFLLREIADSDAEPDKTEAP